MVEVETTFMRDGEKRNGAIFEEMENYVRQFVYSDRHIPGQGKVQITCQYFIFEGPVDYSIIP